MSDPVVNPRTIAGPPPLPRQAAPAAGLFSKDRLKEAAEIAESEAAAAAAAAGPAPVAVPMPAPAPAAVRATAPVPPVAPVVEEVTEDAPRQYKMTFSLPTDLRSRLRSVYRATRTVEDDESLSAMLAGLIERECIRREAIYNGGQRYVGGGENLKQGRPLR